MTGKRTNAIAAAGPAPESGAWAGDLHPLLAQVDLAGGLRGLSMAAHALRQPRVANRAGLVSFLRAYYHQLLLPCELPAICRAYTHAARSQALELVNLDQELGGQARPRDLVRASRRLGRSQLAALRPLRGERVVRRYWQAVQAGQAQGWHTLVYGLVLAVYSLPLRQGLLHYARQTLHSFIGAAAGPLQLPEWDCHSLLEELCADLPRRLETLLSHSVRR
jgi:urease accessory protein UreF